MNQSTTPSVPVRQWRISTLERADAVFPLRDYFRRVGLTAEVCAPTELLVETDLSEDEVREAVRDWERVNGMTLDAEAVDARPTLLAPPAPSQGGPRLGELLVRKGFVTEEQLVWALNEARSTGELLGVVLLRSRLIFEDELARTLSEQLSIPYLAIKTVGVNPFVARLLPPAVGESAAAIPVRALDDRVQVVFADPTDQRALGLVHGHLPKIDVAVAELSDIRFAWREVLAARDPARQ